MVPEFYDNLPYHTSWCKVTMGLHSQKLKFGTICSHHRGRAMHYAWRATCIDDHENTAKEGQRQFVAQWLHKAD